ncbi:hypothetical protein SK128_008982 [Halocaridina rubra]|uniref:Uncharacterized protein n=1 Tax=Halocaridina rubra TaxID=373956 RepID=A0AAN8WHE2_HALRR
MNRWIYYVNLLAIAATTVKCNPLRQPQSSSSSHMEEKDLGPKSELLPTNPDEIVNKPYGERPLPRRHGFHRGLTAEPSISATERTARFDSPSARRERLLNAPNFAAHVETIAKEETTDDGHSFKTLQELVGGELSQNHNASAPRLSEKHPNFTISHTLSIIKAISEYANVRVSSDVLLSHNQFRNTTLLTKAARTEKGDVYEGPTNTTENPPNTAIGNKTEIKVLLEISKRKTYHSSNSNSQSNSKSNHPLRPVDENSTISKYTDTQDPKLYNSTSHNGNIHDLDSLNLSKHKNQSTKILDIYRHNVVVDTEPIIRVVSALRSIAESSYIKCPGKCGLLLKNGVCFTDYNCLLKKEQKTGKRTKRNISTKSSNFECRDKCRFMGRNGDCFTDYHCLLKSPSQEGNRPSP